jgi:glucosamine-6-phosphate deaminase
MKVIVAGDPVELGQQAGKAAAALIHEALNQKETVSIILATGTSQFETLKTLTSQPDIDWARVVMFHLDEYIGLPITAPASFRKYLKERFIDQVPALAAAHLINGETDAQAECDQLGGLIAKHPVDVALVGVGENGHLAFNDPPADFQTEQPYIIVDLDEACRKQQLGEGWFGSLEEVPRKAISMSIRQIMQAKRIICSVPDSRKAPALKNCLEGPVTNLHPASILQQHPDCTYFLDRAAAALLSADTLRKFSS